MTPPEPSAGERMIARLNAALADRYRVERPLGRGGMATVYLAEDLKHARRVAMKVLEPELAAIVGADRFLAEIRTTATLQHPHILPLHDSGEADGLLYYVMPYVAGESLRERLDREKQLPVEEAVKLATDVADALQAAHEQGIVHRDIKPGNILLSRGRPLVADFGIALAVKAAGGRLTETGLSVGTPYYMSPEQASADRDASAASDVYSLGCVLYEMLTGDPPHPGSSAQAVLAKILTEPAPAPAGQRPSVPPNVDAAVRRALEKLPADRFTSARAFADALADPGFRDGAEPAVGAGGGGRWKALALTSLAATVLMAVAAVWGWTRSAARPLYRLDLSLEELDSSTRPEFAVSPDGTTVAVIAVEDGAPAVHVRRLSEPGFRRIEGSAGAEGLSFSPDGEWVLFDRQPTGRLLMARVDGGAPVDVFAPSGAPAVDPHWGSDGEIVFVSDDALYALDAPGGTATLVADSLGGGRMPFVLPDGSVLVGGLPGVRVVDRTSGEITTLIDEAGQAVWLGTGHLLWGDAEGTLWAAPFDADRRLLTGPRVSMLEGVSVSDDTRGFAVSETGVLAANLGIGFLEMGRVNTPTAYQWVDLDGTVTPVDLPPGVRGFPKFSPDGTRLTFREVDERTGSGVLWVLDLRTGERTQISFTGDNDDPAWSPDGALVAFSSRRPGSDGADLFVTPVDNSGPDSLLLSLPGDLLVEQWLPDGRIVFRIGYGAFDPLYVLDPAGGEPVLYPGTADQPPPDPVRFPAGLQNTGAAVSPDGTLMAFVSAILDEPALFIREFPDPVGRYRVSPSSTGGGYNPQWSPSGDTLYYWTRGAQNADSLMAAVIDRTSGVAARGHRNLHVTEYRGYDLHPGGRRFMVNDASAQAGRERFVVLINWDEEVRRRAGG